jgi:tetratricopeptide (TPR) repeat protein/predicted Ser/Thr protein kinase
MSINLPTSFGPYEVLNALGRGGMGEVYRARDTRLEREVALKFLDDPDFDRVVREARAASALNHPNIVTVYEIGEAGGRRFIVMEFVNGRTLRQLLDTHEAAARFAPLAAQVAQALAAAHAAGIIHRDLKPENIMVRDDGYVKVVDFGLARRMPGATANTLTRESTVEQLLAGTPRYMSPEQVRSEPTTSASDIFSFGVVAYEWITGRHPFSQGSVIDLLHAITSEEPLGPSRITPDISPALEALILEMLQKDPLRRPNAAEIVERLAGVTAAPSAPSVSRAAAKSHRVGRARESGELDAAFDSVAGGEGVVIAVAGEAGMGKTTLVEAFLGATAARHHGCFIAQGRCSERLAGTEAYLPLLDALESLLRGEGRQTTARLMKSVAPTWYLHVAGSAEGRTPLSEMRAASSERLKRELLAFFEELSRLGPVVLFLDDVHWADLSTVDALAYIAIRLDRVRILIIPTYRPTELQLTRHAFLPLMRDLVARGRGRELVVDVLSPTDIAHYFALTFPGHSLPAELLALVNGKTEGNPLFMVDMARDLRDREVIRRVDGEWVLTQPLSEVARDLPASIKSLIQRKIDLLDEEDRRILVAASVQGLRFDTAVIAAALEIDPAALEERLDRLERLHGFVTLVGEQAMPDGTLSSQFRFAHVLYQNEMYGSLRPVRRAALSGITARTLVKYYGREAAGIASELAFLFETARDPMQAARYFLIAVQKALRIFAYREAIALASRGLDQLKRMPESKERSELELDLQLVMGLSLLFTSGYAAAGVEQAMTRARMLGAELNDTPRSFRALELLWTCYFAKGDLRRAADLGAELLGLATAADDRRLLVAAHQSVGFPLFQGGRLTEALTHLDQSLAFDDLERFEGSSPTRVDWAIRALIWSSMSLGLLGHVEQARTRLERGLARSQALRQPFSEAYARSVASWCCHQLRDAANARRHAEAALAVSLEHGLGQWIPISQIVLGWAMADSGVGTEGIARLRNGLDGYAATGAQVTRPQFLAMLAEACIRSNLFDDALAAVDEGLVVAERNGDLYWTPELHRLRGAALLARGNPDAADDSLQAAVRLAHTQQSRLLSLRATIALSRLWAARNKLTEARSALSTEYGWFTEGFESIDLIEARAALTELSEQVS